MSDPSEAEDELIERLLAGTPDRVLSALTDPSAHSEIDATREALHLLAHAVDPVAPPAGLRARVAQAIASRVQHRPRRAVAVLDMIEDYLIPGRPLYVPRAREIIPAIQQRIAEAREHGEPVVFLCDHHEPGDPDLEINPEHALEGTTGWHVIPELAPQPGDVIVKHRTYSAFFESDFADVLARLNVNELVLTGCATELQILATATDAVMRGFHVQVPPACQAGASFLAEQVALGVVAVMRPLLPMPSP